MSELALHQPNTTITTTGTDPTGGRLIAWADAAQAANQLARALSSTSFVPAAMKDPGNATAAILMGDELGFSPIAALRSIYVVHGTPALYARAMVALVQSHGHELWTEETSDAKVVVCGRRRGSEHVERSEWTIQRATKAGYTSNKKYGSNPQEMLYSKAAGEVARKIAADTLAGIPYTVEDLELDQGATTTVTRETARKPVQRRAKAVVEAEPEPEPESEPDDVPEYDDSVGLITDGQSKHLHALVTELGLTRDQKLAGLTQVTGRTIESSKDLTKDEATHAIDSLKTRTT